MLRINTVRVRIILILVVITGVSVLFRLTFNSDGVDIDQAAVPGRPRDIYLYPKPRRLIDLHIEYLINNDVCGKEKIFLLILVTSHPGDVQLRNTLRNEFNQSVLNLIGIRRVFMLAIPDSKSVQKKYRKVGSMEIEAENEQHHDLIQGNFTENYRNLTYKHLMGLDWSSCFCPQSEFVLKQDDDIFVDLYGIVQHLKTTKLGTKLKLTNSIYGKLLSNKLVLRDPTSKWFVTPTEYPGKLYPDFVSGWAYVTTPKVVAALVDAAQKKAYFWIDDVHVTGTLRNATGATILDASLNFATHAEYLECCHSNRSKFKYWCDFIIGPDEASKPLLRTKLLDLSRACYESQTCVMRPKSESLLKRCVHIRKSGKKQVAMPGRKGKPVSEPVTLHAKS